MRELWKDESGVTTVEYALILALVSLVALLAWQRLGTATGSTAQASANAMDSIPSPSTITP